MTALAPAPATGRAALPRAGLLLSVLVHAAVLLWLLHAEPAVVPIATAPPKPLEVRWLPAASPAPVPAAREHAPAPNRPAPKARPAPLPPPAAAAAPDTGGIAQVETPAGSASTSDTSAAATPAAAPALDLSVPRTVSGSSAPAQQATADPRANVRRSQADAMARRLVGTGQRTEQRMAHGGWVVRQGTRCWEVRPARANDLHPFDATARPIPHGVRSCDDD